jgi:hypothetical protein
MSFRYSVDDLGPRPAFITSDSEDCLHILALLSWQPELRYRSAVESYIHCKAMKDTNASSHKLGLDAGRVDHQLALQRWRRNGGRLVVREESFFTVRLVWRREDRDEDEAQ